MTSATGSTAASTVDGPVTTQPDQVTVDVAQPDHPATRFTAQKLIGSPQWDQFSVTLSGEPSGIVLEQMGPRTFRLLSDIVYHGPIGLRGLDSTAELTLRTVGPATLPDTDLASVPAPFRWWVNTYGIHSPAALIHDRFIGSPAPGDTGRPDRVTERHIDRYFRFMMKSSGMPFFRRWLMWAAVATRTRVKANWIGKASIAGWFLLTVAGFFLTYRFAGADSWLAAGAAAMVPALASLLWARQVGAGLMMAYVGVPFLLLPALGSVPFIVAYVLVEAFGKQAGRSYRYLTTDAQSMDPIE